jgi:hypothetical protein
MAKKGNVASVATRSLQAEKRNEDLRPVIEDIRSSGATSLRRIAVELNERGITSVRGGAWSAVQVGRVIGKLEQLNP